MASKVLQLDVLIDGQPVGTINVTQRFPNKVFGQFIANKHFERYRPVFEAAVNLAKDFDDAIEKYGCDDPLWEKLMGAYDNIKQLNPVLAGISQNIDEFALEADWSVEITLKDKLT